MDIKKQIRKKYFPSWVLSFYFYDQLVKDFKVDLKHHLRVLTYLHNH